MCISATVLAAGSLLAAGVGTAVQIDSAIKQQGYQEIMLAEQREQMREAQEMERMRGLEAEIARLEEFNRNRSNNLAAMAASGFGDNMSFLQGITKAEERALQYDLRNIRIGMLSTTNRLADQIKVNRLEGQIGRVNRNQRVVGGLADFTGSAIGSVNLYNTLKTPGTQPSLLDAPAGNSSGGLAWR